MFNIVLSNLHQFNPHRDVDLHLIVLCINKGSLLKVR